MVVNGYKEHRSASLARTSDTLERLRADIGLKKKGRQKRRSSQLINEQMQAMVAATDVRRQKRRPSQIVNDQFDEMAIKLARASSAGHANPFERRSCAEAGNTEAQSAKGQPAGRQKRRPSQVVSQRRQSYSKVTDYSQHRRPASMLERLMAQESAMEPSREEHPVVQKRRRSSVRAQVYGTVGSNGAPNHQGTEADTFLQRLSGAEGRDAEKMRASAAASALGVLSTNSVSGIQMPSAAQEAQPKKSVSMPSAEQVRMVSEVLWPSRGSAQQVKLERVNEMAFNRAMDLVQKDHAQRMKITGQRKHTDDEIRGWAAAFRAADKTHVGSVSKAEVDRLWRHLEANEARKAARAGEQEEASFNQNSFNTAKRRSRQVALLHGLVGDLSARLFGNIGELLNQLFTVALTDLPSLMRCDRATLFLCGVQSSPGQNVGFLRASRRRASMEEETALATRMQALSNKFGVEDEWASSILRAEPSSLVPEMFSRTAAPNSITIRLALDDTSIAGSCAVGQRIENVQDATEDARFDQSWDIQSGFTTQSVLCVPLLHEANGRLVLGCLQLINKRGRSGSRAVKTFNREDERVASDLAAVVASALVVAERQRQEAGGAARGVDGIYAWDSRTRSACRLPA